MSSGLAVFETTSAIIIFISMANNRSPNNAVLTSQSDKFVIILQNGITGTISNNISHITTMSNFIVRATVSLLSRVEVSTSNLAAFSQVSVLVDVEAVFTGSE